MEATVSIPIAMGLGWWADRHFGTEPALLFVGLGLGFATFVVRMVRMREMVEQASGESKEGEQGHDGRD